MMMQKKRFEIQEKRQESFPSDRIPFYRSATSAYKDQVTFLAYRNHEISKKTAILQIAENNFLYYVSEEQFDNEYHILGYDYFIPEEIERTLNIE